MWVCVTMRKRGMNKVKMFPVKFIILFYVCINYGCETSFRERKTLHIITYTHIVGIHVLSGRERIHTLTKENPELLSHPFAPPSSESEKPSQNSKAFFFCGRLR